MKLPSVYAYLDFRRFLKEYYEARKQVEPGFTHRYIAQKGGFDSGLFTKVLTGKRNISIKMIFKFVEAFGLQAREEEYFELLVLFDRAKTHSEKKVTLEKIMDFKECAVHTLAATQYEYYGKWFYTVVREILAYFPFKDNYEELAAQLVPAITVREAKKSIKLLAELGLIRQNKQGYYEQSEPLVSSGYESKSVGVNNYILKTMDMGKAALDRFSHLERNLSTVTFSISHERYQMMEDRIREFRRELMQIIKEGENEDRIYQLNMQLFPLTEIHKAKKKKKINN